MSGTFVLQNALDPEDRGAVVDGEYRYLLWRRTGETGRKVVFVMLNPSTADHEKDDPTIRRCMGFARKWGYRRLEVVNLFAYRATDPKKLGEARKAGIDVVGPKNDEFISQAVVDAGLVVMAWGNHRRSLVEDRIQKIMWMFRMWEMNGPNLCKQVMCLGLTNNGSPRHPLYVMNEAALVPYKV